MFSILAFTYDTLKIYLNINCYQDDNYTNIEITSTVPLWQTYSQPLSLSLFVFLVPSSKLSVIVVRKKCMSRFFTEVNHTIQNPPLGTVVDSEATRPEWQVLPENRCLTKHSLCVVWVRPCSVCRLPHVISFSPSFSLRYDFYLVSQAACRGTVSPTYYNVIYDDNGLKPDHMQRLTFKLCHLYYNWPVSDSCWLMWVLILRVPNSRTVTQFTFVHQPLAQYLTFHKGGMNEQTNERMTFWVHSGRNLVCHRNKIAITVIIHWDLPFPEGFVIYFILWEPGRNPGNCRSHIMLSKSKLMGKYQVRLCSVFACLRPSSQSPRLRFALSPS